MPQFSLSGGNTVLTNEYTKLVQKHKPDSPYNWEQDNVPLEDLEKRTDFLYQKAGFPGKGIAGATLTLSSTPDESNGVFSDIPTLISQIPNVLTFPLLIEICKYGNLGELTLNNISCEGEGGIEIVNRISFDGTTSMVAALDQEVTRYGTLPTPTMIGGGTSFYDKIYQTKSSRLDIPVAVTGVNGWQDSARVLVGTNPDARYDNATIFAHITDDTASTPILPLDYASTKTFNFSAYGTSNDVTIGVDSVHNDAFPRNETNGSSLALGRFDRPYDNTTGVVNNGNGEANWNDASGGFTTLGYGNHFTKVTLRNCNGDRIKLTNICVDGGTGNDGGGTDVSHNTKDGFSVEGCSLITLENCVSMRNYRSGFKVSNSEVFVEGSIVAWRNYPLASQARTALAEADSFGLLAFNSDIEFETYSDDADANGLGLRAFQFNRTGIKLINSKIQGGSYAYDPVVIGTEDQAYDSNLGGFNDNRTSFLNTSYNNKYGIHLLNGQLDWKGRLQSYCNVEAGIFADKSKIKTNTFCVEANEKVGIYLNNSTMEYGSYADLVNRISCGYTGGTNNGESPDATVPFCSTNNGQNFIVENSSHLEFRRFTPMHHFYNDSPRSGFVGGRLNQSNSAFFATNHGSTNPYYPLLSPGNANKPAIFVEGNSSAELLYYCHKADTSKGALKGTAAVAYRNSSIRLYSPSTKGTIRSVLTDANDMDGAGEEATKQWASKVSSTPLFAGKNSSIEISGPIKIVRVGICALAEDHSTISFNPPYAKSVATGKREVDSVVFDTTGNYCHTRAVLHSLRACLVANKNSIINMEYCGGRAGGALPGGDHDLEGGYGWHSLKASDYQHGHIHFFPNAFDDAILDSEWQTQRDFLSREMAEFVGGPDLGTRQFIASSCTTGGMCVRAIDNSVVNVDTVAFGVGYSPMMVSGAYYNLYGSGTEHKGGYNGANPEHPSVVDDTHLWEPTVIYPPYKSKQGYPGEEMDEAGNDENRWHGGGYGVGGGQILIWNICDTSRIKASKVSYTWAQLGGTTDYVVETFAAGTEGASPQLGGTRGDHLNYHGPYGVWHNGVALDYYGTSGYALSALKANPHIVNDPNMLRDNLKPAIGTANTEILAGHRGQPCLNKGVFRLFLGVRADLRRLSEKSLVTGAEGDITLSSLGVARLLGGTPMHQLNSQGYLAPNPAGAAILDYTIEETGAYKVVEGVAKGYIPGDEIWRHSFSERNPGIKNKGFEYEVWGYGNTATDYSPVGTLHNVGNGTAGDAPFGVSSVDVNSASGGLVGYPTPRRPLHISQEGFIRNWLDERAADLFANAKHLANPKIGGVSIYLSHAGKPRDAEDHLGRWAGGEATSSKSSTHGTGVRSLNLFDLNRLL